MVGSPGREEEKTCCVWTLSRFARNANKICYWVWRVSWIWNKYLLRFLNIDFKWCQYDFESTSRKELFGNNSRKSPTIKNLLLLNLRMCHFWRWLLTTDFCRDQQKCLRSQRKILAIQSHDPVIFVRTCFSWKSSTVNWNWSKMYPTRSSQ